jgi:hypothetical protein
VDLGEAIWVNEVRLMVSQFTDGDTRHTVSCRPGAGIPYIELGTLVGATADSETLELVLMAPSACRLLRIETLASPSWVAWLREIEVIAAP